ncbi:MAG: hypothetical protein CMG71_00120 [Candidatus Marinimicrobia bacterium]|nr:hypothetical protein [Candidatus Neomarinimicrobiota bacterium]
MTLTHVFRAQSVFMGIWALISLFAPKLAFEPAGWEVTQDIESVGQYLGLCMLGFSVIFWLMPTWAGDNLKQPAMIMGVYINILFLALGIFHFVTDAANFDPTSVALLVLVGLFFWKSR